MSADANAPFRPMVFVKDESSAVQQTLSQKLHAGGARAHFPDATHDPSSPTKFIGGFKCALLTLDDRAGKDDPVDEAELLRLYQPTLPVGFLYSHAPTAVVERARVLGPVFKKPDQLDAAASWALGHCADGG